MKEPKLLPWMARKAGIDLDEARALWRRAVADAAALTGQPDGAAFHGLALDRFTTLLGPDAVRRTVAQPHAVPDQPGTCLRPARLTLHADGGPSASLARAREDRAPLRAAA